MTDRTTLLKLIALGAERAASSQSPLDLNALAVAARTVEAWHLYLTFSYDTAEEGGVPGSCSIMLPEAEDEDVLRILRSGIELGGYRVGQHLDIVDLTGMLGSRPHFLTVQEDHNPLHIARIVAVGKSCDVKIFGNLVQLRQDTPHS